MSSSSNTGGQTAVLVRAAEAELLRDGPDSDILLLADADATGGALTSNRATLRQGSAGAPPHFHTLTSELFFVLDGVLQVLTGEQIVTLHAGDFLVVPPYLPHAFAPAPDAEAEVLIVFSPGIARFDYYRLLERVYRGEANVQELLESGERFDNHYVDSPVWRVARTS